MNVIKIINHIKNFFGRLNYFVLEKVILFICFSEHILNYKSNKSGNRSNKRKVQSLTIIKVQLKTL